MPPALLDIHEYNGPGYRPLVDFDHWRVAVLNFSADLLPEHLTSMQRHNDTDEVFVLLAGRCILFTGEGTDTVTRIHAEDLQPNRVYNVRQGSGTPTRSARTPVCWWSKTGTPPTTTRRSPRSPIRRWGRSPA